MCAFAECPLAWRGPPVVCVYAANPRSFLRWGGIAEAEPTRSQRGLHEFGPGNRAEIAGFWGADTGGGVAGRAPHSSPPPQEARLGREFARFPDGPGRHLWYHQTARALATRDFPRFPA